MAATPKYTLHYFDFEGRAEHIRLAFFLGNVQFADVRFKQEDFKQTLRETFPLKSAPVLEIEGQDGFFCQSKALLRFAGKIAGLWPKSLEQQLMVDVIVDTTIDFQKGLMKVEKSGRPSYMEGAGKKYMKQFDDWASKSKYFVGEVMTVADIWMYTKLILLFKSGFFDLMTYSMLEPYKNLVKWLESMEKEPGIVSYKAMRKGEQFEAKSYAPEYKDNSLEDPEVELTYFDFEGGRVRAPLTIFHMAGVKVEDKRVSMDEFKEMKADLPLGALPIMRLNKSEEAIPQSVAMLKYACRRAGLFPEDPLEALKAEVLLESAQDFADAVLKGSDKLSGQEAADLRKKNFGPAAERYLKVIDGWLGGQQYKQPLNVAHVYICDNLRNMFDSPSLPFFSGLTMDMLEPYKNVMSLYYKVMLDPRMIQASAKITRTPTMFYNYPAMKLYYFDVDLGRAEHIRLALSMNGVKFTDERLSQQDFKRMQDKGSFPLKQVPCLQIEDGPMIPQSVAILNYVARITGMEPKDQVQKLWVDTFIQTWDDFVYHLVGLSVRGLKTRKEKIEKRKLYMDKTAPQYLTPLNKWLIDNGTGYCVGSSVTAADLFIYTQINTFFFSGMFPGLYANQLASYTGIMRFYQNIHGLPAVRRYYIGRNLKAALPAPKNIKLHYFDTAGLGEPIRMTLFMSGIPFEDARFTGNEWPNLKENFPNGKVPVLEIDGQMLSQSSAILRYVGKLGRMYSNDPLEAMLIDQTLDTWPDISQALMKGVTDENKKEQQPKNFEQECTKYFKLFDEQLKANSFGFMVGSSMTIADVLSYCFLKMVFFDNTSKYFTGVTQDLLQPYTNIMGYYERMDNDPAVLNFYRMMEGKPTPPQLRVPTAKVEWAHIFGWPQIDVTYFKTVLYGRVGHIYNALLLGGLDYEETRITGEEFGKARAAGEYPLRCLPVMDVDGTRYCQSVAMLRYAGKLASLKNCRDMYPSDAVTAQKVDEVIEQLRDFTTGMMMVKSSISNGGTDTYEMYLAKPETKLLLEGLEKRVSNGCIVGSRMTIADLMLTNCLNFLFKSNYIEATNIKMFTYPQLLQVHETVTEACAKAQEKRNGHQAKAQQPPKADVAQAPPAEEKEDTVTFNVKYMADGTNSKIAVNVDDKIVTLRDQVAKDKGTSSDKVTLIQSGKKLEDDSQSLGLLKTESEVIAIISTK